MRDVEKITRIVEHIKGVIPHCQVFPGLPRNEIEAKLSILGVELHPELIELYEEFGEIYSLDGALSFLSLPDAALCYQSYREFSSEGFSWWPSLFPLLDMNGDIQLCVDLETTDLYLMDVENGTTRHIYRDYRRLLNALLEAVDSDIYYKDPGSGSLILEKSAWTKIKVKHGI